MSRRWVQKCLAELLKAGEITSIRRGKRVTNEYAVMRTPVRITDGSSTLPVDGGDAHSSSQVMRTRVRTEEIREETRKKIDSDSGVPSRKKREKSIPAEWSTLASLVETHLGRKPSRSQLGRVLTAAGGSPQCAVTAIQDAVDRGYGADNRKPPRSAAYFESIVRNYQVREERYELPPATTVQGMTAQERQAMAAFDPLA